MGWLTVFRLISRGGNKRSREIFWVSGTVMLLFLDKQLNSMPKWALVRGPSLKVFWTTPS